MTRDSLKFGLVANDFFWLPIFFWLLMFFLLPMCWTLYQLHQNMTDVHRSTVGCGVLSIIV